MVFSFCLMVAPVSAEPESDTVQLSLQDALTRAVEQNPLVRIEKIDTDVASAIYKENIYKFEPQLQLSIGAAKSGDPAQTTRDASLQITETLPTGTQLQLKGSAGPLSGSRIAAPVDATHHKTFSLTVTQALLQGLSPSVNLVPVRRARIDVSIREEELSAYALKLIYDTEKAYWDLVLSQGELSIFQHSLDLAKRLLFESEERLKVGRIAALDLAAIRAEVASRNKQLIDAEAASRQKTFQLVYLMNGKNLWNKRISLSDTLSSLGNADSLNQHLEAARKFRSDLRLAKLLAQKGDLDLMETRNGLLPRLDFFISLQGTSYAESFSSALSRFDEPSNSLSGGITFQMPVTNGIAREKHRRAVFSSEQQKLSLENFDRLLEYDIRSAHLEVSRALSQIEAAKVALELQQQKLEAEQEKMNVGKSTGYALLQVQRDLIAASLDEQRAKAAYRNSLLLLFSRDGTLLQRRGIKPF